MVGDMNDMEWVIRWMQAMTSLGIDYTQRFGIPVLELPPNRYSPMQFSRQAKYEEREGEGEADVKEGDEQYHAYVFNDAFISDQPSVEGVQFHNTSQSNLTQSAGRWATEEVASHGKYPIIEENQLAYDFD
ncbi:hypothetical protein GOBAR_DD19792 [Gossypium barbadense]|nr:hypothetical protein GOBAR_DD19792 [Gossypium barbadense]